MTTRSEGFARLRAAELALAADDLRLGRLADRAGVDDDEVGGVHRRRLGAAGGQQAAGHLLRVAPVHLAAQGPDEERRQRTRLGTELDEAVVVGRARPTRPAGPEAARSRAWAGRGWSATCRAMLGPNAAGSRVGAKASARERLAQRRLHLRRDPQSGVRLGVRLSITVEVRAAGLEEAELRRQRVHPLDRRGVELPW